MQFQQYPSTITQDTVVAAVSQISRIRGLDITIFNNYPNLFVSGRTVGKIPTSSTDIAATDKIGDMSFAADGSFVYYCVNASGTAAWRRIALATW